MITPVVGYLAAFGPPPDTQEAEPAEERTLSQRRREALEQLNKDDQRQADRKKKAEERKERRRSGRERTQDADKPGQRSQRPAAQTGAQPAEEPKSDILDTLTGVSGTLKGQIAVEAVDSRRIVVTGDQSDVEFIEQVLTLMEASAPSPLIEVFTLEEATATALAPIIETTIQGQIEARTQSPGPHDKFSINAEGRSNSLIVSASEDLMEQIAVLVEKLDVKTEGSTFATVPVENMRAVEAVALLKPTIEKLMAQRDVPKESQPSISAIERNNSVMIVGTPKHVEEISGLVKTVDVPLTKGEEDKQSSFTTADVILVQLQNAQATNVAEVLTEMIEEQQEAARQVDPEKPGEPFVKVLRLRLPDGRELPDLNLDRPIKILPEEGTNSLIIFSSKDNNEALTEIVRVFDTLPIGAETDVKAFTLKHALAEDVAELVQEIFDKKRYIKRPSEGDDDNLQDGVLPPVPPGVAAQGLPYPLLVQHDVRSNTVFVIGRTDAVILAGGLIQELDLPTIDVGVQAFLLPLKRMQAAPLAEKLESILDDRAKAMGADNNEGRDNAVVQPDERSNSLIIFATAEMYELIEDLALQLDATEKYSTVDVRYRPLKFADALKIQGLLEEMFEAKESAESDLNPDAKDTLNIQADIRSNSLLLTGTLDYLDEAEALVNQLDQEFDGTVVFEAFKIKLNSAANLAALLNDMIEKTLKQQDSSLSGSAVHVAADPISDTLLVAAAREDMALISRWIEILDRPSEVGRMTRIIPLRRAVAEDASQAAQDIFNFQTGQGGEVDVTITAESMTNSVVVFGPPGLVQDIEEFVRQLDQVEPHGQAMVRIFKLDQADAEIAGELLTRILEGEGGTVGSTGGSGGSAPEDAASQVMLIWQQQHPDRGMETLQGMRSAVTVLSDIRTNSLVITASPETMPLMESLVAAIDVPPDAAKIRVFALRNSDAEQMVQMLQELFERQSVTTGTGDGETERILTVDGLGGQGRSPGDRVHDRCSHELGHRRRHAGLPRPGRGAGAAAGYHPDQGA